MSDPTPSETLRAAAARLRAGSPLISPVLAEPLAAWLDDDASDMEVERRTKPATSQEDYALTFARSILEQQP